MSMLSDTVSSIQNETPKRHHSKKRKYEEQDANFTKKPKRMREESVQSDGETALLEPLKKKKKEKEKSGRQSELEKLAKHSKDTALPIEMDVDSYKGKTYEPSQTALDSQTAYDPSSQDLRQDPSRLSQLNDTTRSPFHSVRISLYLPIPAISLSSALPSLLSTHLAPLLLTYYGPANGIVLAFEDPTISAYADTEPGAPLVPPNGDELQAVNGPTLARPADDFGVSFAWLSITLLVFRPTPNEFIGGWINVCSDSFIGLISYNYFQTGIGKSRIPKAWVWANPNRDVKTSNQRRKGRKAKINDSNEESSNTINQRTIHSTTVGTDEIASDNDDLTGFFSSSGVRISNRLSCRVVDCDIVPTHSRDREKWYLKIEGSLLDEEEEASVKAEEKLKWERLQSSKGRRVNRVE